jgi:hypothetical protein
MIQRLGKGEANTEKIVAGFGEARPFRKWADYAAKLSDDLGVIHNEYKKIKNHHRSVDFGEMVHGTGFQETRTWRPPIAIPVEIVRLYIVSIVPIVKWPGWVVERGGLLKVKIKKFQSIINSFYHQ